MLAAAYARTGQIDEAKRWLSEADRLWPYYTVRSLYPEELSSPRYAQQIRTTRPACGLLARATTLMRTLTSAFRRMDRCASELAGLHPDRRAGRETDPHC